MEILHSNFGEIVDKLFYHHTTIRELALSYDVSKSTMHNYLHSDMFKFSCGSTYCDIQNILNDNFNNKYLRGGQATKMMYLRKRSKSNS